MLGDGGETPTRHELLSMVKKHSKLLSKGTDDEDDFVVIEMDSELWRDILDLYFVRSKESRGREDDDLIFFVRKMNLQNINFNEKAEANPPYFVRRWAPKLDKMIGESSEEVDWRRSFYLNMIAHTSFSVTVAICSQQVLRNHQSGPDTPLPPIYKVVKTVYASPSRVNFHLDSKKEVETTPAYPDICFAVDDFDSTFDAVVLTDTDHCYCVLLNAHAGAAFPSDKIAEESISEAVSGLRIDTGSGKTTKSKLTLFSGFVSYQMVRDAYEAGKSRFGSLMSLGQNSGKVDRLYMKGPGGRGEVEVAVSGVTDQSQAALGPFSPVHVSKRGFGTMIHKAAFMAQSAAKQAYAAAASSSKSLDDEMVPLKCCLMSISLPWEHIAYDLLFKGTPPVNM
uniref:Cw7 protein n=1 Tax=Kalanchoe fedtschenkoi TaxID=63787 RepID=A0A7N0SXJ2_KALFE